MKIPSWIKKTFKKKPIVELYKDDDGYYVVKCYGQYLTRTLTRDRDEADRLYEHVNNYIKSGGKKRTLIKSNVD